MTWMKLRDLGRRSTARKREAQRRNERFKRLVKENAAATKRMTLIWCVWVQRGWWWCCALNGLEHPLQG
ncbi:hypothetical protein ACFX15_045121 [Malus domestica]